MNQNFNRQMKTYIDHTSLNNQRPKLRVQINNSVIEGTLDMGADVSIII